MKIVPHLHMTATERRVTKMVYVQIGNDTGDRVWGTARVKVALTPDPTEYGVVRVFRDRRILGWIITDEAADGAASRLKDAMDRRMNDEIAAFCSAAEDAGLFRTDRSPIQTVVIPR